MNTLILTAILGLLIGWIAYHFWRNYAMTRDVRRCSAVFTAACEALKRGDDATWYRLRDEHQRLVKEFKHRWGYTL